MPLFKTHGHSKGNLFIGQWTLALRTLKTVKLLTQILPLTFTACSFNWQKSNSKYTYRGLTQDGVTKNSLDNDNNNNNNNGHFTLLVEIITSVKDWWALFHLTQFCIITQPFLQDSGVSTVQKFPDWFYQQTSPPFSSTVKAPTLYMKRCVYVK
jgi:hypothetical protein